jgi:hypothetical protein
MSPIEDGGPAFPASTGPVASGMSMRDVIATAALAALISKAPYRDAPMEAEDPDFLALARGAYLYSDAMLAMRTRTLTDGR